MFVVRALMGIGMAGLLFVLPLFVLPEPAFSTDAKALVDKLSQLCSAAAGEAVTYDLLEGCACPRNHVFTLSSSTNEPTCTVRKALPSQSHCAESGRTCYVGADALSSGGEPQGATVSIHSKSPLAQQKAKKYAGAAFERWLPAQGFTAHTSYQFGVDFPDFFADISDQNQLKSALGLRETLLSAHKGAIRTAPEGPRRYYAHNPDYFDFVVGIEEDFNHKGKKAARNLLKMKPWLRPLYIAYVALLEDRDKLQDPKRWQFTVHKGNGCQDACRMVTTRRAVEAHRVHYWQEIIRGKITGRYLVLDSVYSNSQLVLFFSPSFVPTMFGEIFYTWEGGDQEGAAISENIHLYDLNGVILANRQAPVYSRKLQALLAQHKKKTYPEGDPLIVCAGGSGADEFDWLRQELVDGRMLLGPYESLFGWSRGKYAKPLLAGVARQDFGMLSATNLSFGPLRATVAAARSVATNLQAVPIGSHNCVANVQSWQRTLAATGAKVALLPEPDLLAAETVACQQQLLGPIDRMADRLWVSAAGNEGRQDFAGSSCLGAKPRPNTLTVAGSLGNDGSKWSGSNHGLATADVLAYGGNQDAAEPLYDTAFAAARTAALAATLATAENLSGPEARLAVLLGATYDESLKDVTRSSAWLDLDWFYSSFAKE